MRLPLYADLKRLAEIAPRTIKIDLLTGTCSVDETRLDPPLRIATGASDWLAERIVKAAFRRG
jgi:hypothetical protein